MSLIGELPVDEPRSSKSAEAIEESSPDRIGTNELTSSKSDQIDNRIATEGIQVGQQQPTESIWSRCPLQHTHSIRIIYFDKAGSDFTHHIIGCRMICIRVKDDNHPYSALSYAWGTVSPTEPGCTIIVDGVKLTVGHNLFRALLHIWTTHPKEALWVDAISIHQSDTMEKNRQVQEMTPIFKNAATVRIWLGDEDDKTETPGNFLRTYRDMMVCMLIFAKKTTHG
ncbi:hypothetical protein H2200_004134 [Cladophialophora chaetospira]|uniref:Heterokaryon incompatibility domain-containing protein n=1 Tax=Cladophialophora chaetospira TaxID=386627 RepID=A0AA38XFQ4_9EURO|nr:hypothetical protein H2200_004134 [Cladophialophora chaetospira]